MSWRTACGTQGKQQVTAARSVACECTCCGQTSCVTQNQRSSCQPVVIMRLIDRASSRYVILSHISCHRAPSDEGTTLSSIQVLQLPHGFSKNMLRQQVFPVCVLMHGHLYHKLQLPAPSPAWSPRRVHRLAVHAVVATETRGEQQAGVVSADTPKTVVVSICTNKTCKKQGSQQVFSDSSVMLLPPPPLPPEFAARAKVQCPRFAPAPLCSSPGATHE